MSEPLMATYQRLPVTFERGEGVWLWDTAGKQYLDALSGIAVCNLGHAHPVVAEAICAQAQRLVHTSNVYGIAKQEELGRELTALAGMDRVFFANSGAEANEAAIKLARLHGHKRGVKEPVIVVMENSFHGRTMATLTATGNRKAQAGFEPLLKGFVRVAYGKLDELHSLAGNPNIVAILLEPIQGEGGINIPADDFLPGVRALCDAEGWLMMLDEVQAGMARTGKYFAFQHSAIQPDVMTLAKALGNGMPIGACLARGSAADTFGPGSHGSTFGGNPLACSAALAVLKLMQENDMPARAAHLGQSISHQLHQLLGQLSGVVEVRHKGCMIGIELDRPCASLVATALDRGLLINVTAERVIRLLPPLIMSDAEAQQLCTLLSDVVRDFLAAEQHAA
jgi:acetylornithine aminotransferase